jgi:hypothetical protein
LARDHELAGGHAQLADVGDPPDRRPELDARVAGPDGLLAQVHHAHDCVADREGSQRVDVGVAELDPSVGRLQERDPILELADIAPQVVVEAPDDALLGHRADGHREETEDREGERGAQHRDLQLHREAGPHGSLRT